MLDVLITGGEVYDGTGGAPVHADVGIAGDRVARIGPPGADGPAEASFVISAAGKAVAPGFINILSHSYLSILHDPRSLGELTQGVTTQVFGGTFAGRLAGRARRARSPRVTKPVKDAGPATALSAIVLARWWSGPGPVPVRPGWLSGRLRPHDALPAER